MFCVRKRSVSLRCFQYAQNTYVLEEENLAMTILGGYLLSTM